MAMVPIAMAVGASIAAAEAHRPDKRAGVAVAVAAVIVAGATDVGATDVGGHAGAWASIAHGRNVPWEMAASSRAAGRALGFCRATERGTGRRSVRNPFCLRRRRIARWREGELR